MRKIRLVGFVLLVSLTTGHDYLPPQPSRSDPTLAKRWSREVQRAHDVVIAAVVSDSLEGPRSIRVMVERSFKGMYQPGTLADFVISGGLFSVDTGAQTLLFIRPSFAHYTPDVIVDPIHSGRVSGDSLWSHCPYPSPNTLDAAARFIQGIVQTLQVDQLAASSDIVVQGKVRNLVDCEQIKEDLNAWCTVEFEVRDVLLSVLSENVERSAILAFTTCATSMRGLPGTLPRLDLGDEAIVFLSRSEDGGLALLPGVGIYAAWIVEDGEAGVRYRLNAFEERTISRTSTSTLRREVRRVVSQ